MPEKQIEFDPLQTHDKRFERAMVAICLVCIVIVVVVTQFTTWGTQN